MEAVLLTALVFLGFNAGCLLLLDDGQHPRARTPGHDEVTGSRKGADVGKAARLAA